MLRNVGAQPKSPMPEVSSFYIHFTLLTLNGLRDNKRFKFMLFKGIQKASSNKQAYNMMNGSLNFEQAGLQVSIYNFNIKRPNNSELSLILYEVFPGETQEDEVEYGTITLSVSSLINTYIEKEKNEKQRGQPVRIDKKDKIGSYQLQYIIYIDKNKHNVQNFLKTAHPEKIKEQTKKQSIVEEEQPKEEVIAQEVVSELMAQNSKMRALKTEEVEAIVDEEIINQRQPGSLLKDSIEYPQIHPEEQIVADTIEQITPDDVKKQQLGIIETESLSVDNQTQDHNFNRSNNTPSETVQEKTVAKSNNKLFIIIFVAIVFIYLFFIRGRGSKTVKNQPAKSPPNKAPPIKTPQTKTPTKVNKPKKSKE